MLAIIDSMTLTQTEDTVDQFVQVGLIGLFITALVSAQLTAAKVLAFEVPFSAPIAGNQWVLPGGAVAIALMFFTTDCYAELFGRRAAQILVNIGFLMNFVVLALVWFTILAPAARSSIDPAAFRSVLGASTNIVIASLLAYLVSQNWDVIVFHAIREYTAGAHLWLRNILSTATSQAIDTVLFVTIAFYGLPRVMDIGPRLSGQVVGALIIGQYLLKLLIVLLDTPFVYLIVGLARSSQSEPVTTH